MLEIGLFHNGQTDLAPRRIDSGEVLPSGNLSDMHASMQRGVVNQVGLAVLADKLGFDYLWLTEHHFIPEGAEFSPNPLLVEAAIAAQTQHIRLGQYANILTWWHPIRIAEQAALLDVISGGRLEFGIGRGYQSRETEVLGRPFGATVQDQERNRAAFDEALEIVLKAWTEPSFSHHGDNFSIPPHYTKWHHPMSMALYSQPGYERSLEQVLTLGKPDMYSGGNAVVAATTVLKEISVFPQPLQKPHPQMWMPLTSERSARWAAAHGVNGGYIIEPIWRLKINVEHYYDEAEKLGWPDRHNRGRFKYGWDADRKRGLMMVRKIRIVKDPSDKALMERIALGYELDWGFAFPFGFAALLANPGEKLPADVRASFDFLNERGAMFVGTAEDIAERILAIKREVGFEDFNLAVELEIPGASRQENEEQMHMFVEDVLPILRRECGDSPRNKSKETD